MRTGTADNDINAISLYGYGTSKATVVNNFLADTDAYLHND